MIAVDTDIPVTEHEKVEAWRLFQLVEAGYPLEFAEKLAASDCDLHRAVALVRAGCPAETAFKILRD